MIYSNTNKELESTLKMAKSNKTKELKVTSASQNVSKNMKSTLNALTKYVTVLATEKKVPEFVKIWNEHQGDISKVLSSNLPKEKVKKLKDKEAPKRGKSSYIFFCIENRQKVKDKNDELSAKDITKELGSIWRELTDKSKKVYEKHAIEDKERYIEEMKGYVRPSHLDIGVVLKNKKRKGPKRGLSSYIYFCKEQRPIVKENNNNMSAKEITTELGRLWKLLSDADKKPFEKSAKKDKKRYETEKADWVENESGECVEDLDNKTVSKTSTVSKKSPVSKKSQSDTKLKRKKTGYILYCQEERPIVKSVSTDLSNTEVTKELGANWKSLTDAERIVYNERACNLTE
jgi:hypothetical protein